MSGRTRTAGNVAAVDGSSPSGPDTTHAHAVAWLRNAIVAGELVPGQRVHQEDIADRIGVSVAPIREALRVLEGEGQLVYRPRRGYFVAQLNIEDLVEIYALRQVLEERAVRRALPGFDDEVMDRMTRAAQECSWFAAAGDVTRQLDANRRFHFELFDAEESRHTVRLIRLLWDSTESYRAMYYNLPSARDAADESHGRILEHVRRRDADALVAELDDHRAGALDTLGKMLAR
jgi:DNA-binding GntR family transcriptional regulator